MGLFLEVVFLGQLVEVLAVHVGVACRGRNVAVVAVEQPGHVVFLELVLEAGTRVAIALAGELYADATSLDEDGHIMRLRIAEDQVSTGLERMRNGAYSSIPASGRSRANIALSPVSCSGEGLVGRDGWSEELGRTGCSEARS